MGQPKRKMTPQLNEDRKCNPSSVSPPLSLIAQMKTMSRLHWLLSPYPFSPTSSDRVEERRTHVPQPIPSSLRQVVTISDDEEPSSDEFETQHQPFSSWPTGGDRPGLSQFPSASQLLSPHPSPQIPMFPPPTFVELAISSPAGQLRMLFDQDREPLPYYAVLKGERPGVYYGRYIWSFFLSTECHSPYFHSAAARRGGGTSKGQVWCCVISEEEANRMFVTMFMRGEVSRIWAAMIESFRLHCPPIFLFYQGFITIALFLVMKNTMLHKLSK